MREAAPRCPPNPGEPGFGQDSQRLSLHRGNHLPIICMQTLAQVSTGLAGIGWVIKGYVDSRSPRFGKGVNPSSQERKCRDLFLGDNPALTLMHEGKSSILLRASRPFAVQNRFYLDREFHYAPRDLALLP